ncbi:hypothetical protein ACKWTF_003720 [Chironomus riparius]
MDLLSALPEDAFNEIATYLSGKDVLNSSIVCKRWYQMFGQSKECMKKIAAKYTNYNRRKDLNILLLSNRKYQNIKLGFQRTYYIRDSKIEENIRSILKKFADTIVTLETSHDFQRICSLPKLKELEFNNTNWNYYTKNANYFYSNGLMTKCTDVKKLSIVSPIAIDEISIKIVQKALTNMRNLKLLTVNQLKLFEYLDLSECHFRLEEADFQSFETVPGMNILQNQQSTLKVIKLNRVHLDEIVLILSAFPKLHTFHIRHGVFNNIRAIDFPQNTSIKNFIMSAYWTNINHARMIMKLKNLKHLKVYSLYWRTFCAASHCPEIKTIEYQNMDNNITEDQKTQMANYRRIQLIKQPTNHVYT